jgi:hypothetical protein
MPRIIEPLMWGDGREREWRWDDRDRGCRDRGDRCRDDWDRCHDRCWDWCK